MALKRRRFTREFKLQVVREVEAGKPMAQAVQATSSIRSMNRTACITLTGSQERLNRFHLLKALRHSLKTSVNAVVRERQIRVLADKTS